eukprot:4592144-Pleurochrysis_carterae.AAC.1
MHVHEPTHASNTLHHTQPRSILPELARPHAHDLLSVVLKGAMAARPTVSVFLAEGEEEKFSHSVKLPGVFLVRHARTVLPLIRPPRACTQRRKGLRLG